MAFAAAPGVPAEAAGAPDEGRRALADAAEENAQLRDAPLRDAPLEEWPSDAAPGSLLVTTDSAAAAESVARLAASALVRGDRQLMDAAADLLSDRITQVRVAPGREAAAARLLRRMSGVIAVEPDRVRPFTAPPDDPRYVSGEQWAHALTGAQAAWGIRTDASSVKVAVLDSGIDATHEELEPVVDQQVTLASGSVVNRTPGTNNDACGHGTGVAGVIGARGNNAIGIAGVAWEASLLDIALTSSCVGPTDSTAIKALKYAGDQGARVATMSFGAIERACPTAFQAAIDAARAKNVVLIAASGNSEIGFYGGEPSVPASCDGVISVGAVGKTASHASYSTTNRWVDIAAPGGDGRKELGVLTTKRGGDYDYVNGTSFAAPYIAGVAALAIAHDSTLTPAQVEALLEQTARDRGPAGRDDSYGWGLVQAGAALALLDEKGAGGIKSPGTDPAFPIGDISPPIRVSGGADHTNVISQAVFVSRRLFGEGEAGHAVLARSDDYADALAGSSLGYGFGPVLFTKPEGPLDDATRTELLRVLPSGGLVYLMGGHAALPPSLEDELKSLGFSPKRLAGAAREETAALTAAEVAARLRALGATPPPVAILATRGNWPDAVSAGSLGAYFGIPILLTSPDSLHPATAQRLGELQPSLLYVVGGTAVISEDTVAAATAAGGASDTIRLAGPARDATAVAVAQEMELLLSYTSQNTPALAVTGNLRHPNGYAHVLSASAIIGRHSGVFVPVDHQNDASTLTPTAEAYLCDLGSSEPEAVLAGGPDVVSEATGADIVARLAGVGC